ncbi:Uncharacterised protein [uncultured archaeon]|nr:Uncharacterised protein [uncultured archaeon]
MIDKFRFSIARKERLPLWIIQAIIIKLKIIQFNFINKILPFNSHTTTVR